MSLAKKTDSDDDTSVKICSPYHDECRGTSKTPPCILKKNAKLAEKKLQDILDFTEREKMYAPNTVELIEKLEQNTVVITSLQEEVNSLNVKCSEKDSCIRELENKILSNDEELKSILALKTNLETQCKDFNVRLTDLEVTYETLKTKSRNRENELLSLLQEQSKPIKDIKSIPNQIEKESSFMDMSREMSLVNSDNESSGSIQHEDGETNPHKAFANVRSQLESKCQLMIELEADLYLQKQKIVSLEQTSNELKQTIKTYQCKLASVEEENLLLKTTVDTLTSAMKQQKYSLETAETDVESYKTKINNLEVKLRNTENLINKPIINDGMLENMISNEKTFIANNDNINNIIQSFKQILQKRNTEIEELKASETSSSEFETINIKTIDVKNTQINNLLIELEKLKEQLNSNVEVINKMTQINEELKNAEGLLVIELNQFRSKCEKLSEEREQLLKSNQELEETNVKIIFDKETKEQIMASKNEDLSRDIKHLNEKLTILQSDLENKNKQTAAKVENNNLLATNIYLIAKVVNDILAVLGEYPIEELPDNADDLNQTCSKLCDHLKTLQDNATDIVNQRSELKLTSIRLTERLTIITNAHNDDVKSMKKEINDLQAINANIKELCDALVLQNNELTCEFEKLRNQLTLKTEEFNDKIIVKELEYKSEITSILKQHATDIDEVKISFMDQLDNCNKEKSELQLRISSLTAELQEKCTEVVDISTIASKISEIKHSLNSSHIAVNLDNNEIKDSSTIIQDFEMLASEIITLRCHNHDNYALSEDKQQLVELRELNLNLTSKLAEIQQQNKILTSELDAMEYENKKILNTLKEDKILIETLQAKNKKTISQLLDGEKITEQWKAKYSDFQSSMDIEVNSLKLENHKLENLYAELKNSVPNDKDTIPNESERSIIEILDIFSPPNLKTMCYMKLIDLLQPKDNDNFSVANTTSKTSTDTSHIEIQSHDCQCENLLTELNKVLDENIQIKKILQEMEEVNQYLLKEQETVRREIKLLIEPTTELQKKIGNHRTNLSTLIATTYTENKLLKSQVKVLQHHHNRCHNVCQKDLPAVKKQLADLMVILKNESVDKHNSSFKRFSLPDVLDKNSTMSTIKNESILDGDLLMMDTNVTLASTDNTLLGPDQSILEITLCLDNEATMKLDPTVLCSQIEILTNDNHKLFSQLEMLKEKNVGLCKRLSDVRESITEEVISVDAQKSPVKIRNSIGKTERKFYEEYKLLQNELFELKSEKLSLEEKYNNLTLEMPSCQALVKRLHEVDKENNNKVQDINKLKQKINKLQEENDLLSTQLMENIDSVEDLRKQLEAEQKNSVEIKAQLTEKNKLVKTTSQTPKKLTDCQQCSVKEEIIKKFKSRAIMESHIKLNRSNSDSESGSRCNKICTLQNELQESIEDCIRIKNHLERSDLAICEDMDLDQSMGDSNIFPLTREFEVVENKIPSMPVQIPLDYIQDKNECVIFCLEKIGSQKENLPQDAKIIDVMKMLYNKLIIKHINEVDNLVNNLRDFEGTKQKLENQISKMASDYSNVSKTLEEKDNNIKIVAEVLTKIRASINSLDNDISNIIDSPDTNSKIIDIVKDKVFKVLDSEFGTQSLNVLDKVFSIIVDKHQSDLGSLMSKYTELFKKMEGVSLELCENKKCLEVMKVQLTDLESECNLLKVQKERVREISNAVTLDIILKEKLLNVTIEEGFKKLVDENEINSIQLKNILATPPTESLNLLYDIVLKKNNADKGAIDIVKQNESSRKIKNYETELQVLKSQNVEMLCKIDQQESLIESLNSKYKSIYDENNNKLKVIETLSTDVNNCKDIITEKDKIIHNLTSKNNTKDNANATDLLEKIKCYEQEIITLKTVNSIMQHDKEYCNLELEKANKKLENNKKEFEAMATELLTLKETIKQNASIVEHLNSEAKSLLEQNKKLKESFEGKVSECSRLVLNIKIHEKTAEVQNRMINRLQKEEDESKKAASEKENSLEEMRQKYTLIEKEYEVAKESLKTSLQEINALKTIKDNLEMRVSELELENGMSRPRSSLDGIMENSRRRRLSLHDSKRLFDHETIDNQEHNQLEALFGSRSKPDDFFMDVDEDGSRGTTPASLEKRSDSISRHESTGEDSCGRSSVLASAARRRRQSVHDHHRSVITPEPNDHPVNKLKEKRKSMSSSANNSIESSNEVNVLRDSLTSCRMELEELKERYKELDEECEICAEYLKERDEQCLQLKKEKAALEIQITELKKKLECNDKLDSSRSYTDATVNTDEDWANLHNVVVDRMSFDAEVEKNKNLTKAIEEFRFKNRELKATLAKMQRALEKYAERDSLGLTKELESTKSELKTCRAKLEELRQKYKELDEECETCAQYLKERDEQCLRLKEAKNSLEARLQELEGEPKLCHSLRKRRQSLHDQNRSSAILGNDASTLTADDVLSFQVERDNSSLPTDNCKIWQLQMVIENLKEQKSTLESKLRESNAAQVYVATGSGIVQNQQMTDVMKENQKLKKINAKLINICKKRGKSTIDAKRENDEPSEQG